MNSHFFAASARVGLTTLLLASLACTSPQSASPPEDARGPADQASDAVSDLGSTPDAPTRDDALVDALLAEASAPDVPPSDAGSGDTGSLDVPDVPACPNGGTRCGASCTDTRSDTEVVVVLAGMRRPHPALPRGVRSARRDSRKSNADFGIRAMPLS